MADDLPGLDQWLERFETPERSPIYLPLLPPDHPKFAEQNTARITQGPLPEGAQVFEIVEQGLDDRVQELLERKQAAIEYMHRAPLCFYCGDDGCRRCMERG